MALTGPSTVYLMASPGISPYPQLTQSMWVKLPATATTANIVRALFGPVNGYQFNIHFAGNPTPNVFGSQCSSNNGTTIDGTGNSGIALAPWHHILVTYDNGGTAGQVQTVTIYYDGVLSRATTTGGPVTALVNNDASSQAYIWAGHQDGGASVAYPAVWKRVLSQAEITALAVPGSDPRTVAPAQLVSFLILNQGSGTLNDLVTSSIQWVTTGGSFTVVADPFPLTMATTLERASFANLKYGRTNVTLLSTAGITVGQVMTITTANGGTMTGTVKKFCGSTGLKLGDCTFNRPSSFLLLPKGSPIA